MFDKKCNEIDNLEGITKEFYEIGNDLLPLRPNSHVLDLSNDSKLELELYFKRNDTAFVDVIYSSENDAKNESKNDHLNFIISNIFSYDFEINKYEAAISVGLMHNFSSENKQNLYKKIYKSLKREGYFVLVDIFDSKNDSKNAGISSPSTLNQEIDTLHKAGFRVCVVQTNDKIACLKCTKF